MRVLCMRHGHADPATATTGDAGRPLSQRGQLQVGELAAALRGVGVAPTRVLTSPILRARQTAEMVAECLAPGVEVEVHACLAFTSSPAAACALLEGISDGCVFAVGHMPTLPETIQLFSGLHLGGMATAQVVCMEDGRAAWSLAPGDEAPRAL